MFFCKSVLQDGVIQKPELWVTVLVGRVVSVTGASEAADVVADVVPVVLGLVVILQTFS